MIVDFKIKNYRSFKDEVTFSLEASGAKGKSDNVAEIILKNGKKFRLLKTAVIYGANASGKSNIIRAFWAFRQLVANSFRYDVNDDLKLAEPFELDTETQKQPTEFTLNFIGWDKIQYIYFISFSKKEGVLQETLKFYPEKNQKIIYRRTGRKIVSKNAKFFKNLDEKEVINPKRLFLSELGNTGDEYWEAIRNYFVLGNSVINNSASGAFMSKMAENAKRLFENNDEEIIKIRERVIKLIQISDLGIKGLSLVEEDDFKRNSSPQDELEETYIDQKKQKRFKTYHNVYKNYKIVESKEFDLFKQGSTGTVALVGLSTEIISALSAPLGRPIWIDEIDNSMHPYLCRFMISLFHHPLSNPFNSQLIFATHETTLLDRNNFRKDQIWITSKDKYGCTKLYSVYDLNVDGLRDDIPFDKWYLSGKFGGLPNIKEMDYIFSRNENKSDG